MQGGRCAWCGKRLTLEEAHADHKRPYKVGGATDEWNLQLIHLACHQGKTRIIDPLRDWQREFVFALDDHTEQTFLLAAPVGTGKTRGSIAAFNLWRNREPDALCIIVSPSIQIIRGWAAEAGSWGKVGVKNLDPSERKITLARGKELELLSVNSEPPRDLRFWLMTYGSLGSISGKLHSLCRTRPVFAILDEIHHASSREDKAWGDYVEYAFGDARRILCVTATPRRTDRQPVSYFTYDDNGEPTPHYELELRRAIREELIARTEFFHMDGEGSWRRITADDEVAGSGRISSEDTADTALFVAVRDRVYQDECIKEGLQILADKRERIFPEALCLIFAQDNVTAADIGRRLNIAIPGSAVVATSDTPDAHRTIDAFRNRTIAATTLVACGMASEGCDIPNVKVTINLQNRRSYVDFIQRVVGRGSRAVGVDVTHSVVLPAHPELHRLAVGLLDYQGEPLREIEDTDESQDAAEREMSSLLAEGVENIRPLWYSNIDGTHLIDDEAARLSASTGVPPHFVQQILDAQKHPVVQAPEQTGHPGEQVDHNRHTLQLRAACRATANRIARRSERYFKQWSAIYTEGHRRAGISLLASGIRELGSLDDDELTRLHSALLEIEAETCL